MAMTEVSTRVLVGMVVLTFLVMIPVVLYMVILLNGWGVS